MRILFALIFALLWSLADACSSAVVSRKFSSEGEVLIWKHRDQTNINDCRIVYFDDGKYAYITLANSYVGVGQTSLGGVNEVGFGYISTATKNLDRKPQKALELYDGKYSLMCRALRECRTVDEFEALLKVHGRYDSFESNVGVGDAEGGAAYFEIWSDGYVRYDVDTYDIRTNFSFAGRDSERGASVRRYNTVRKQMESKTVFSPADFIGYSRSFYSADKGDVLADDTPFREANYVVPRPSSVASIVVVCSKNPRMEVIVGHPVAGMSVPVWVAAKGAMPKCVSGRAMYDLGRKFVAKAYYKQGKNTYLNKDIARKALKIDNHVKTPSKMPTDMAQFNYKVDRIFEKHQKQMMQLLN